MPRSLPWVARAAPSNAPLAIPIASALRTRAKPRAERTGGQLRGTASSIAGQYSPIEIPSST